jgi:hypothetical protein
MKVIIVKANQGNVYYPEVVRRNHTNGTVVIRDFATFESRAKSWPTVTGLQKFWTAFGQPALNEYAGQRNGTFYKYI